MCCFSGKVEEVKNTRIFARLGEGRQMLIYEMAMNAATEVAMVLPIPVQAGSGEKAVKFYNFQDYAQVFADLHAGFPAQRTSYGNAPFGALPASRSMKLEVVSVGAFDASFVPTIADFSRLDERFRLPAEVWPKLPGYQNYGFAVFKLKAGKNKVQPMAFSFPTSRPQEVFFPTLHIHDGEIHEKEHFDHTLYCQGNGSLLDLSKWSESPRPAVVFAKCGKTHGFVLPEQHVYRRRLMGKLPNGDIVVKPRS